MGAVGGEGAGRDRAGMSLECEETVAEAASQRRIVLSDEAESSRVPSGEKAQDVTAPRCPPSIARRRFFVTMSNLSARACSGGKRPRAPWPPARGRPARCSARTGCDEMCPRPDRTGEVQTRNTAPGSEAPSKRVRRARPPFTSRRSPSASVRSAPLRSTCRNTAFPNLAPRNRASRRASNEPSAGACITQSRKSAPSSTNPAGEGVGYLFARA